MGKVFHQDRIAIWLLASHPFAGSKRFFLLVCVWALSTKVRSWRSSKAKRLSRRGSAKATSVVVQRRRRRVRRS